MRYTITATGKEYNKTVTTYNYYDMLKQEQQIRFALYDMGYSSPNVDGTFVSPTGHVVTITTTQEESLGTRYAQQEQP